MSLLLDIADAVVSRLTAGVDAEAFAEQFTPVRSFISELRKEDCTDLQVRVVGGSTKTTAGTLEDLSRHEIQVEVVIAKQVDASATAAVEALIGLTEDVRDWVFGEQIGDDHPATDLLAADAGEIYDRDRLKQDGLFYGVVTLNYVTYQPRPSRIGDDDDVPLMLLTLPTPTGHLGVEDRLQLLGVAPYWEG